MDLFKDTVFEEHKSYLSLIAYFSNGIIITPSSDAVSERWLVVWVFFTRSLRWIAVEDRL